jgi:hypothetical protein
MSKEAPKYICWFENDFMADRAVIRMNPHQQLMYRQLCQVARFCETRPYLPDDDSELYLLANADSLDHWKANREAILVKFNRVTIGGVALLAQKRVLTDHDKYDRFLESRSKAGKASAASRSTGDEYVSTRVEQSNESNGNGKRNAILPQPLPHNLISSTGSTTSQPQNSELTPQNSQPSSDSAPPVDPMDQTTAQILNEFGCPAMLAWIFDGHLKRSNARRKEMKIAQAAARPNHWKKTWAGDFERMLQAGYTSDEIQKMIKYVLGTDRWLPFIVRPAGFVKCHADIASDLDIPVREVAKEPTKMERDVAALKVRDRIERDEYREKGEQELHEARMQLGVAEDL